ncbi:MAG TPA: L-lactate permease [Vicinamibacteria bacterium]|nr:L-lactate permease [Vicinamibacteria bacterium]
MPWTQRYDPLGSWPLSTLVSALPVLTLFFVLIVLRKRVWIAALSGMLMAVVLAAAVFHMPAAMIASASLHGFVFGFLRIAWIIIASIFLYNVAVETGQFQVMKESIAALSSDQRLQAVLIAFCFGAFLEGTGGGGAPVAIAGSFLIGLGFPPFQAATVCLLANTAPVAWGAAGNPIRVLAGVTGLPEHALNAMTGRILPAFSFILPIWLVRSMTGWTQTFEVLPALLVAGGSFAAMQFFWSNFVETNLVDIVAAAFSLLVMVGFLRVWKPRTLITFDAAPDAPAPRRHSVGAVLKAWSPFAVASLLILLWALPAFVKYIRFDALSFPLRGLHNLAIRVPPVVPTPTGETAIMDLNALALPGTAVFAGGFLCAPFLGMSLARAFQILGQTIRQLVPSMLAISFMVGLAYVTKYAGMDTVLGLSLTRTGWIYPFFGTLLGWVGVALTGTDAGSNALFGNLQKVTAEQLGISPILMASANSAGGVMGKMIDAQSIVVASTSTRLEGREADIFKAVIVHSIVLASLVGLVVMLYAYVIPGIIPGH